MIATTKLYNECERYIIGQCILASRSYGVTFDEAKSYANELFMEAVRTYEEGHDATFLTYLRNILRKLSRLGNKNLLENKQFEALHLMSEPINSDSGEDFLLEEVIGALDKEIVNKDFFSTLNTVSCDARDLAWEIAFGEVNHDAKNYQVTSTHRDTSNPGRPRAGEIRSTLPPLPASWRPRTKITEKDCHEMFGSKRGWDMCHTKKIYREIANAFGGNKQ